MAYGETYDEFVEKFRPKKTTDDCYTPEPIYNAVSDWVSQEYGLNKRKFVRPFYPGGDYEKYEYPEGCVVVDNPPFSIISKILKFYNEKNIRFFLFAPTLTLFQLMKAGDFAFILTNQNVTYKNGAKVETSFVTNLEAGCIRSSTKLYNAIKEATEKTNPAKKKLNKYKYDKHVFNAATLKTAMEGNNLYIPSTDYVFIRQLDSQKSESKAIFGGGILLSDEYANYMERVKLKLKYEKLKSEREMATVWELSERERKIVLEMGRGKNGGNCTTSNTTPL